MGVKSIATATLASCRLNTMINLIIDEHVLILEHWRRTEHFMWHLTQSSYALRELIDETLIATRVEWFLKFVNRLLTDKTHKEVNDGKIS